MIGGRCSGRPRPARLWSMDFVFDRTGEGHALMCLMIADDATHEAAAVEVDRAILGNGVARILHRLALRRGLRQVIRSGNGKEFCGKAMVKWGQERGVVLRLIEPVQALWSYPRKICWLLPCSPNVCSKAAA